jgi:hypothetical protein
MNAKNTFRSFVTIVGGLALLCFLLFLFFFFLWGVEQTIGLKWVAAAFLGLVVGFVVFVLAWTMLVSYFVKFDFEGQTPEWPVMSAMSIAFIVLALSWAGFFSELRWPSKLQSIRQSLTPECRIQVDEAVEEIRAAKEEAIREDEP